MRENYAQNFIRNTYSRLPLSLQICTWRILCLLRIKPPLSFFMVAVALTYNCNAHCNMCSIKKYKKKDGIELTTEEVKSLINQLSEVKTDLLNFFGGEPLLRKDIFELIKYAHEKGILPSISTNGFLISEKIAKKLKDAGLFRASINLSVYKKKIHDMGHNLPGCFTRTVNAINYCIKNNIQVLINIVATKNNIRNGSLNNIILLGKKLKVTKINIIIPTMAGGWFHAKKEMLEPSDYEKIIPLTKIGIVSSEVKEFLGYKHMPHLCKTGRMFYVSCYGDVQPCYAIPISFGNIREKPLKEILESMQKYIKQYGLNTKTSIQCVANDEGFRAKYLKDWTPKTALPIRLKF